MKKTIAAAALALAGLTGCVSDEEQPFADGDNTSHGGQCWVLGAGNAPGTFRPL